MGQTMGLVIKGLGDVGVRAGHIRVVQREIVFGQGIGSCWYSGGCQWKDRRYSTIAYA